MNRPLRRLGTAVIVMIGLLLANITYTQVIKADDYRADPNNKRTLVAEYSRQRGQITGRRGGARPGRTRSTTSTATSARTRTARCTRASPATTRCGTAPTRLERTQNAILSGEAPG